MNLCSHAGVYRRMPTFAPWRSALTLLVALGACAAALAVEPAAPNPDDEAVAALQAAYARAVVPGEAADAHRALLASALSRIKRSHATEVDLPALAAVAAKALEPVAPGTGEAAETFRKAINQALRSLDPHSRYLDARAHANERSESSGSFSGLGMQVEPADGAVRVVSPIPGGPAERAGVQAGDLIVRIDDQPLAGVALADAVARMRGEPGTAISITVRRAGSAQERTLALTRDTIRRQLLFASRDDGVLVLRLTSFSGPATHELGRAIHEAAVDGGVRALVLDLRGNPGGLLREAIKVADLFLASGEIVSVRGNGPARQRAWLADPDEMLAGVPMVVLIDGRSASASELVADALKHHGRATVIGQRSLGKGSVQTTFTLGEQQGALKLTTALYHGPSGLSLDRVGVYPDVELVPPSAAEARDAAARRPVAAGVPRRADPARCAPPKAADPVLACAMAYLAAGNTEAFMAGLAQP